MRTIKTSREAGRLGGAEALGFLPLLAPPAGARPHPAEVPDLRRWLGALCANIAPRFERAGGVVILVSSAKRGEGRSTLAINLAAFFAHGGERVLLIEADRAAHVKKPPRGLLDVLKSGENLKSAFVSQGADGYTLLPHGGRKLNEPSAVDALMSGASLLATLKLTRQWFDVIVIDGPPALEAAYADFLAAQADKVLFLIEWNKTTFAEAEAALDRLESQDTNLLFNKTDAERLRLYEPERLSLVSSEALAA